MNQKHIFISYRRDDSQGIVLSIRLRLERETNVSIFHDIISIPDGYDLREYIREGISQCDIMLVIIGEKWLSITDEEGNRRLDNPKDLVRNEIRAGLERRPNCLVIPVLVDGAIMPREDQLPDEIKVLSSLLAPKLRHNDDFEKDIQSILTSIHKFQPGNHPVVYPTKETFKPKQAVNDFYGALSEKNWTLSKALLDQIERYKYQVPDRLKVFDLEKAHQLLIEKTHLINDEYDIVKAISKNHPEALRDALYNLWKEYPCHDPDNLESKIIDLTPFERGVNNAYHFKGKFNRDWNPVIVSLKEIIKDTPLPDMEMCLVPIGKFMRGNISFETIRTPYWIARYPVTNAEWHLAERQGVVEKTNQNDNTTANYPVVHVNWQQALTFANWVGCTLPNELETEYAIRGVESLDYPWGHTKDNDKVVWQGNSNNSLSSIQEKPKGRSWVGARHLIGNVWEWQRNFYSDYLYQPDDSHHNIYNRALRGGSYSSINDVDLKSTSRRAHPPSMSAGDIGFRCVLLIDKCGR